MKNIKKITFYNIYDELNKDDFMFTHTNTMIGDDLLLPMHTLKKLAHSRRVDVGTVDRISFLECDAIVFVDYPSRSLDTLYDAISSNVPIYLLALESSIINPDSHDPKKHRVFKNVFTWNDELVEHNPNLYKKINYSFDLPKKIDVDRAYEDRKLCVTICGNKKINAVGELYSKRLEVIEWFENNAPKDFDLYGIGWDQYSFNNSFVGRIFNKIYFVKKLLAKDYVTYKGPVVRKRDVLKNYNFAICYENNIHPGGYITEKIFDAFFCGTIPIYLGAENVKEFIPETCFIDARNFQTIDDLYKYIKGMPQSEIDVRRKDICEFLASEDSNKFSVDTFSKVILDTICC